MPSPGSNYIEKLFLLKNEILVFYLMHSKLVLLDRGQDYANYDTQHRPLHFDPNSRDILLTLLASRNLQRECTSLAALEP